MQIFRVSIFSVVILSGLIAAPLSAQPDSLWSNTYHGRNIDEDPHIIQTSDGGYAIAGGTGAWNGGNRCGFLVKTDSMGNELWSREFEDESIFGGVIQSPDGGYILGGKTKASEEHEGGICLLKTDENGEELWWNVYGRASCESVIPTADGGYVLAGTARRPGTRNDDFYLVKTDSIGAQQWSNIYDKEKRQICRTAIQTDDGGYALAGVTSSFSRSGRIPDREDFKRSIWDQDGKWLSLRKKKRRSTNIEDFYLVRTDAKGNLLWSGSYGCEGWDQMCCYSLVQTEDGGFALAGKINPSNYVSHGELYLVRTDSLGNELWSQWYGGKKHEEGSSIILMADGGFVLAGSTSSFNVSKGGKPVREYYLVRTDSDGVEIWFGTYGGAGYSSCNSVIQSSDGGFALIGTTNACSSEHIVDFWLIKTGPETVVINR